MPRTRHTVSGVVDENTPEHIVQHPVLGKYLEVVDENAKPFLPIMHKPTTVKPAEVEPLLDKPVAEKPTPNTEKIGKD